MYLIDMLQVTSKTHSLITWASLYEAIKLLACYLINLDSTAVGRTISSLSFSAQLTIPTRVPLARNV